MSNIIDAETKFGVPSNSNKPSSDGEDRFLITEGLDLLANYRSIWDPNVRFAIRDFVRQIALSGYGGRPGP